MALHHELMALLRPAPARLDSAGSHLVQSSWVVLVLNLGMMALGVVGSANSGSLQGSSELDPQIAVVCKVAAR